MSALGRKILAPRDTSHGRFPLKKTGALRQHIITVRVDIIPVVQRLTMQIAYPLSHHVAIVSLAAPCDYRAPCPTV